MQNGSQLLGAFSIGLASARSYDAFSKGDYADGFRHAGYVALAGLGLTGAGAVPATIAAGVLTAEDFAINLAAQIQEKQIRKEACDRALKMLRSIDATNEEMATRKCPCE